ncbi:HNH endonuclease [Enterococcus sp. LJL90]
MRTKWKKYISKTGTMYSVSNKGKIRKENDRDLKSKGENKKGYVYITMGSEKMFVHRLVAELFCKGKDTIDEYGEIRNQVDHIDFQRQNNRSSNLRWMSEYENSRRKKH